MKNQTTKIINPKDFDVKIRPQDDFYHFACGGWLKRNPIPKTEVKWGSFTILRDRTRTQIKGIFTDLLKKKNLRKGSSKQQLRDFYISGMDEKTIEKQGLEPLAPELAMIESVSDMDSLIKVVAHMHSVDNSVFWSTMVGLDDKDSSKNVLHTGEGSLGLPEKEYYLSKKKKFIIIRKKYFTYLSKLLKFSGTKNSDAKNITKKFIDIETKLAKVSMSAEQRRDVEKMYNKMTTAKLRALAPNINWPLYFQTIGVKSLRDVIVSNPKYIKELNKLIKSISINDWKDYLRLHLISSSTNLLSNDFVQENFSFYSKTLFGAKRMKPRWQSVYAMIDGELTEAIGKEYIDLYFSKTAEDMLIELIDNIKDVYKNRIKNLDWMSARTKKLALRKLSTFVSKIGGPKKMVDYSKIKIKPDTYLRNAFNASQFEFMRNIKKLNKPVDRKEWFMGAHVVNAYYWANQNEIVFPAAILQPPFFDERGDVAINYGAIGAVIGHELTHGFDDNGSLFDEKGNMRNWWTKKDMALFKKKTKIIEKQYNDFIAVDDLNVNGKLTLGENIADLGGAVLAYYALQKYMKKHGRLPDIGGFTPEQRFFFGLVLVERANTLKETIRVITLSDPHATSYTRINGPLSNMEEFYEAFDVKKGDKMYKDPKKRAKIW